MYLTFRKYVHFIHTFHRRILFDDDGSSGKIVSSACTHNLTIIARSLISARKSLDGKNIV